MYNPNKIIRQLERRLNERPSPTKDYFKKIAKLVPKWAYRALANDYIVVITQIKNREIETLEKALRSINNKHIFISKEAMLPTFMIPEIFNVALEFHKKGIRHITEGDIKNLQKKNI